MSVQHPAYDNRRVLDNVTTADIYTPGNTLWVPGGIRVFFQIANAPIFIQFGRGKRRDYFEYLGDELRLNRLVGSLNRRFDFVRIRSAVAGDPAIVTLEALTRNDLP